jgi:acyl-CoA thioester hydrolase
MELSEENRIYKLDLAIKTYDIDIAGHVNNIVYIKWLEDLRYLLYSNIFDFQKVVETGFYPVVTHTSIKYIKQIKLFEKIFGTVELTSEKHGMLFLKFQIRSFSTLFAEAEQQCVMMDLNSGKMVKSSKEFRRL